VKSLRLLILCLLAFIAAPCISAQTENATITGRVTDPSKAIVVGAEVVFVNTGTNVRYQGKTNGTGSYVIAAIPPGSYRAEVGKPGFKTIVETGVVLHTQDAVELNFEMALGKPNFCGEHAVEWTFVPRPDCACAGDSEFSKREWALQHQWTARRRKQFYSRRSQR
jgi:hypothetical protein